MTDSDLLARPAAAAARYAAWKWPVLPVHTPLDGGCSCRNGACTNPGKHPRLARGVHQASTDRVQVAAWWDRWPDANVAIATGALVVLDIDGERGRRSLRQLEAEHGPLPATAWVATARGRHLYFLAAGLDVRNSAGRLGPGLDVRGRGGYVIAPPSLHHRGRRYRWHDLEHGIAALPARLARRNQPDPPNPRPLALPDDRIDGYVRAALDGELQRIAAAPPRTRNDTLNRAAFRLGQLAGAGLTNADALRGPLLAAAQAVGQSHREALATIASGLNAGLAHPRAIHRHPPQP